ncbi:MAG: hypothetical protein K6U04_05165 [Armatimonadetes bacterium]|nr:hypothetical protein [Armatimonadota bacterium]
MFAVFKTGPVKQRSKAWALLFKKCLEDPFDRNLQQLAEFALKNELVQFEDVEEVLEMARQMSTEEKERMYQLFTTHPVSRAWSEKIRAESLAKGKIEGKQEVICKFLARRFGLDSAEIQEKVRRLTDLQVLDDALTELFAADSIEEARRIITTADSGRNRPE